MNTERFLDNITEQIKEAQLKLGFAREVSRLYFPAASLNILLDTDCKNAEEMLACLQQEPVLENSALGALSFTLCKGERIEVCIPPKGAEYVHEQIADPPFLKNIVELFSQNHHLTLEEIRACFAAYNKEYVCQKMEPGTDFDYVLYFPDKKPDEWYYCIRMEMGHTIYHRFIEEDYRQLL